MEEKFCTDCMLCVETCPVKAIGKDGTVNVRKCVANGIRYGLPALTRFISNLVGKSKEEVSKAVRDPFFWNVWQSLRFLFDFFTYRTNSYTFKTFVERP